MPQRGGAVVVLGAEAFAGAFHGGKAVGYLGSGDDGPRRESFAADSGAEYRDCLVTTESFENADRAIGDRHQLRAAGVVGAKDGLPLHEDRVRIAPLSADLGREREGQRRRGVGTPGANEGEALFALGERGLGSSSPVEPGMPDECVHEQRGDS